MSALRARQIQMEDFQRFDWVLAMDEDNLAALQDRAPAALRDRVRLFLDFAPDAERVDVPDPYYGGSTGFEEVLDLVEAASAGLIRHLRQFPR